MCNLGLLVVAKAMGIETGKTKYCNLHEQEIILNQIIWMNDDNSDQWLYSSDK